MKKRIPIFMAILISTAVAAQTGAAYGAVIAMPTAQPVLIGARTYNFDAYNIGGYNYFKLRDLGFVLSNTDYKFAVGYDDSTFAITLNKGVAYKAAGGEMAPKGTENKTAAPSRDSVVMGSKTLKLDAYKIDGYNYYKLRDLGGVNVLNFRVDYQEDANAIVIWEDPNFLWYNMYVGKPAYVKKDAKIENAYQITQDANGKDVTEKLTNLNHTLKAGTVVIVTAEENGRSRFMAPSGDAPALRGFLNSDQLEFDRAKVDALIKDTNYLIELKYYKIIMDCTTF
ncbi:MAG: hypothetical protein LBB94_05500 [Clostridiales bacterium]|jgi:hypothetical protein|nr:hypothetical protein [Clostridiales bacterium]